MASITYERTKIAEYQKRIIDSPARFTVTEASTKVGKTASHLIWLFEQALMCTNDKDNIKRTKLVQNGTEFTFIENPVKGQMNKSVWWVAPVFSQAEIAYKRMKEKIGDRNFFKVNESKLLLTLPTGVEIHFKSAERPDNLYGDDVYAAVDDEFTRQKEDAWFALRTTLTHTKGKCKFIGNVKGRKNWGWRLAQRAKNGEADHEYFKITAYDAVDAGILDLSEVEAAKRDLPESVFKELYLAEASEDGSNPFGMSFIKQCSFPMTTNQPVCFGIDLAKSSDYTVIIGLDKAGCVCYFDRFQKDWRQTVDTIKALPNVPMKIDASGVGDPVVEQVQEGRANVEGFKFTKASKQPLMLSLAMGIQQRKVQFPEGVIKDELENFEYEYTRTGVIYSAPEGLHDDCVCALALAYDLHKSAINVGTLSWI